MTYANSKEEILKAIEAFEASLQTPKPAKVEEVYVDYGREWSRRAVPNKLIKYTDKKEYALSRTESLKLATLDYYRNQISKDIMEGTAKVTSTLKEFQQRSGVKDNDLLRNGHLVKTIVPYSVDDLIFCTSISKIRDSQRPKEWTVTSYINDVSKFALLLGEEFAKQRDEKHHAPVTGLYRILHEFFGQTVVRVYHGPVVYSDDPGEILFSKISKDERGHALKFFKRKRFEYEQEYRFVVTVVGSQPLIDVFYLNVTSELRTVFE